MKWPFRRRSTAIAMPDQSLSASDAGRRLATAAHERERAKVRAMTRHLRELRGLPPHPALEG